MKRFFYLIALIILGCNNSNNKIIKEPIKNEDINWIKYEYKNTSFETPQKLESSIFDSINFNECRYSNVYNEENEVIISHIFIDYKKNYSYNTIDEFFYNFISEIYEKEGFKFNKISEENNKMGKVILGKLSEGLNSNDLYSIISKKDNIASIVFVINNPQSLKSIESSQKVIKSIKL
jgi:hypothetical protein